MTTLVGIDVTAADSLNPLPRKTSMTTIHPDFTKGPDAPQGDLCITRLDDLWPQAKAINRDDPIRPAKDGEIRLLEGEVTGHHHTIRLPGMVSPVMFRDDGLARDMAAVATTAIGTASLVRDAAALNALVTAGCLTRTDLAIGFLLVEGGPVDLVHPEHSTIRLPEGRYYVGRQVESAGAEERKVQD